MNAVATEKTAAVHIEKTSVLGCTGCYVVVVGPSIHSIASHPPMMMMAETR